MGVTNPDSNREWGGWRLVIYQDMHSPRSPAWPWSPEVDPERKGVHTDSSSSRADFGAISLKAPQSLHPTPILQVSCSHFGQAGPLQGVGGT